jgi:hypothetical protein
MMMDLRSLLDPELAQKFDELEETIHTVYRRIWDDWYGMLTGVAKAKLVIEVGIKTSGYVGSEDTIFTYIGERNLEDDIGEDAADWPQWKRDLVHEMLHEYEVKGLKGPSREGDELWRNYPHAFGGSGHEAAFFTAIVEKAPYFNMTPEQFVVML